MTMRRALIAAVALVALVAALIAIRIFSRRIWDKRVGDACYAAPDLMTNPPLLIQRGKGNLPLWDGQRSLDMPPPDAIVVRQHSVFLVWNAPFIAVVPERYRTSWDSYLLEFNFKPDGTPVAKCHHGSD